MIMNMKIQRNKKAKNKKLILEEFEIMIMRICLNSTVSKNTPGKE